MQQQQQFISINDITTDAPDAMGRSKSKREKIMKISESLISDFRQGILLAPKVTADPTQDKDFTYSKGEVKRTSLVATFAEEKRRLQISGGQDVHPYLKKINFMLLNMSGSIRDISKYISQRFAPKETEHLQRDAGEIGFAHFLMSLMRHPEYLLFQDSNSTSILSMISNGDLVGLANFLVTVYDHYSNLARESLLTSITTSSDRSTQAGIYNSDHELRHRIKNEILARFLQVSDDLRALSGRVTTINFSNLSDFLSEKFEVEEKVNTNRVSLLQIPRIAQEWGIIENVIPGVPTKYRNITKVDQELTLIDGTKSLHTETLVEYKGPLARLNKTETYKLGYAFGVYLTVAKAEKKKSTASGTRVYKELSHTEAASKLMKTFIKYYATKDGVRNIDLLNRREKFLNIKGLVDGTGDILAGTGLSLAKKTVNVQFAYNTPPASIPREDDLPGIYNFILWCIGFPKGTNPDKVQRVLNNLATVFGQKQVHAASSPSAVSSTVFLPHNSNSHNVSGDRAVVGGYHHHEGFALPAPAVDNETGSL